MLDFSDTVVAITGGGAGIGRATVSAFVELGAQVVVLEIDQDRAAELTDRTGILVVRGDATVAGDVAAFTDAVADRHGRLDVLVNNVGHFVTRPTRFEKLTDEEIDAVYRANLGHAFTVTRAMLPLLRAGGPGGSIVNVTSIEAHRGIPGFAVYGAFKAALTGFTMSLALELGPEGIRVNAVAPETTDTAQVPLNTMIHPLSDTTFRAGFRWDASVRRRTSPAASYSWPAPWRRGSRAPCGTPMEVRSRPSGGSEMTGEHGPICR